ncbi:MAG TPA: DUF1330 domain-containing protein [Novosphingobium sp.]|nr:DUF1330 domain-containing protein [Novosphingobium sp.]
MPAYIVVMREGPVQDEDEYAEYKRKGRANPVKVPLKPLSLYGAIHPIEGEAPDGVVMLQFDDVEAARAWYDSPEYQDAVQHRLRSGNWRAFIVEGM